jgi:hypothetical protein
MRVIRDVPSFVGGILHFLLWLPVIGLNEHGVDAPHLAPGEIATEHLLFGPDIFEGNTLRWHWNKDPSAIYY